MNQKTQFDGFIRSIASEDKHPLLSDIEFVFTDFLPNKNKQGVPKSEANNIIRTGMFMPVRANFTGEGLGDHENTLTIGAITHMEQSGEEVVSKGVLWQDIYPDVVDYLRKAVASEGGVHFSWELYHKDSDIDTDGIMWLKDCVVAGVAIVNTPAYDGRTPLLSIASEQRVKELEQQLSELRKEHADTRSDMTPDEMKAAIEAAIKDQMTAFFDKVTPIAAELVVSEESPEFKALRTELDELKNYKNQVEEKEARAALRTSRSDALKDILPTEEFTKQEEFILGLSDEQFTKYVETVSHVARQAKASVNDKGTGLIPDPVLGGNDDLSISELAKALREEFKKR